MARYIDADELSEEISSLKIFVSGDNVFYEIVKNTRDFSHGVN